MSIYIDCGCWYKWANLIDIKLYTSMRSSFILFYFLFCFGILFGSSLGARRNNLFNMRLLSGRRKKRKFRRGGKMCRSERVNVVPFSFSFWKVAGPKKEKGKNVKWKNLKVQWVAHESRGRKIFIDRPIRPRWLLHGSVSSPFLPASYISPMLSL